eukprot:4253665-Karenia_brevis.AAC.1
MGHVCPDCSDSIWQEDACSLTPQWDPEGYIAKWSAQAGFLDAHTFPDADNLVKVVLPRMAEPVSMPP